MYNNIFWVYEQNLLHLINVLFSNVNSGQGEVWEGQ